MKKLLKLTLAVLTATFLTISPTFLNAQTPKKPVKIIFDTDLGNDVDDTMALAVAYSLQRRGELEVLAVTTTKDNPYVASMISVLNCFYGYPDTLVGVTDSKVTPDDGKYNRKVVELRRPDGQLAFVKNIEPGDKLPDAVKTIRKVLAEAEDQSIVIVQIGFFTNLARLLDTPGDEFSPLDGKALAAKKVKYVSLMAGAFDGKHHVNNAEYNVGCDLPSAKKMTPQWPTPMIFCGFEVGVLASYTSASISNDFEYVAYHPVKEAYRYYRGLENEQATFDLNSVLYAARPDRGYYSLSEPGTVTLKDNGVSEFKPDPNGKHRYMLMDERQIATVREALIQLTSEPPRGGAMISGQRSVVSF